MGSVRGVGLVIVTEVPVRVRVFPNRAVGARLNDFARCADGEHAPVKYQQAIEPLVNAIEIVG